MISISFISINYNFIFNFSDLLLFLFILFLYQKSWIYNKGILSVPFLIIKRYIKLFKTFTTFLCAFTHKILMILIIVFMMLLQNFLLSTSYIYNFISALIIYAELKGIYKLFIIIQRRLFYFKNWFYRKKVFR